MVRLCVGIAVLIAAAFGFSPIDPAHAQGSCPLSFDQCLARCNAMGGKGASSGGCATFCTKRPCMRAGAAGGQVGGPGPGAAKGGAPTSNSGAPAFKGGEGKQRSADTPAQRGQGEGRSRAQPFVRAGRELLEQGKFHAALGEFDRAVQADPKYLWSYMLRGTAHNRLGQLKPALADYDKALEIDPRHFPSLIGRAPPIVRWVSSAVLSPISTQRATSTHPLPNPMHSAG